jgi:hypothetical protein
MGKMQREKGKRGEREFADELKAALPQLADKIKRGLQSRDGAEVADVEGVPGFWFENKCGAKPNPRAALKQAQAAAKADQIVAVRIRDDRQDPFFVLPADDFYTLIGAWFDWQNGVSPFENER